MSERELKVGDRVKDVCNISDSKGLIGNVVKVDMISNELNYDVEYNGGGRGTYFFRKSLQLIEDEPKQTKSAFDFNAFVENTEKEIKLLRDNQKTLLSMCENYSCRISGLEISSQPKKKEEESFFLRFKNPEEMKQFFAEEREKTWKGNIISYRGEASRFSYTITFNFERDDV